MLMVGLPYHASLFAAKQTPISGIKLESRLRVLEEHHAAQLKLVNEVVRWEPLQRLENDAAAVNLARRSIELIESPTLQNLVSERLEMRTLVTALRKRVRGQPAPNPGERWGYGRWLNTISRNWSDPGFRLERAFPWVTEANRLLRDQNVLGLDRLLMGMAWDHLGRLSEGHFFDFEAVAIYVLRWDLIARWTSYDPDKAAQHFATLLDDGLGNAAQLFD
jgi:hypothetical protein